jgi:hypothetical protein
MSTYADQCARVIAELNRTAIGQYKSGNVNEYLRLTGKIEGIQLARDMALDEIRRLEIEAARAALPNAGDTK